MTCEDLNKSQTSMLNAKVEAMRSYVSRLNSTGDAEFETRRLAAENALLRLQSIGQELEISFSE